MESVVLVRVTGPDATQKRAKRLPFSHSIYGKTTVSGSGIVFRLQEALYVVTTAHLLAPFRQSATDSSSITTPGPRGQIKTSTLSSPLLLRDTVIDVLFDEHRKGTGAGSSEQWFASELVSILPIAEVTAAIDRLTANDGATWTVGWSKITQADFGAGSEEGDDQGREQWTKTFGGGFASGEANTKWANADEIALLRLNHESSNERRASSPARGIEWDLETAVAHRGQEVLVVGSPFGMLSPRTFMNAMGTGIVSNVMHHRHSKEPSLLLTDARCMPGQEGGAVLTTSKKLAGMLIPPIRRVDSRAAIDFNFAIPIDLIERTILDSFRSKTKEEISPTPTSTSLPLFDPVTSGYSRQDYQQHLAAVAEQSLVLVKIAANWASGVVVDVDENDDTVWVLTNAHLFHPFLDDRPIDRSTNSDGGKLSPSISTSRDLEPIPLKGQLYPIVRVCQLQSETTAPLFTWHRAEVVYVSSSHLDVALLMMKPKSPVSLTPIPRFRVQGADSLSGITSGREVLVMGFPVFPPSAELAATCSKGVISKVIRVGTSPEPSILLTSAAVHAGNSGGLLLDLATGSFLGLVTCNMKTKSGMMIPRLNYSISTSCLRPIFEYLGDERRNAEKLKEIDAFDEEFDAIWKLKRPSVTASKPKPTTSTPNSSGELSTDPKGAMFRSFVGRVQQGQVPSTHPSSSSSVGSRIQSKL